MAAGASGVYLSVIAGLSASISSVFGKLAFDGDILPSWVKIALPWLQESTSVVAYDNILLGLRGFSFVMIFLSNVIMINLFVKSMNRSTTSEAVVVNTACNFFFTAFFGWLLFQEPLPGMWWAGASLIITGVLLIVKSSPSTQTDEADKIKKKKLE